MEKVSCFFDEIQAVPGWEPFVDRLMRTDNCEVYITGSSAQMLSKEIATQMRSRALSWEIFPFSFREYLDDKGIKSDGPLSINNLTVYLKSLGHKAPKSAVSDYLEWFEDAYVLFTVRIFDASFARSNTNPKKMYCIDHALLTSSISKATAAGKWTLSPSGKTAPACWFK